MKKMFGLLSVALLFVAGLFLPPQPGILANREYRREHPGAFRQVKPNGLEVAYVGFCLWVEDVLALHPYFREIRGMRRIELHELYYLGTGRFYGVMGIANPLLVQKRGELMAKQQALKVLIDEGRDGDSIVFDRIKSINGSAVEKAEHIKNLNDALVPLAEEVKKLADADAAIKAVEGFQDFRQADAEPVTKSGKKTAGQLFIEKKAWQTLKAGGQGTEVEIEGINLKTLLTTGTAGSNVPARVVDYQRRIDTLIERFAVLDLITQIPFSAQVFPYLRQTVRTNNAAETAEGAAKPEAALDWNPASAPMTKIPVHIPVTEELLDYTEATEELLNALLGDMIRERLDKQIIVGDGVAPNLSGIMSATPQTQAFSVSAMDSIYLGIVKVQKAFLNPEAIVMNPDDWTPIRLAKDPTTGVYLFGPPSQAGLTMLWGLPVTTTMNKVAGSSLVGDFRSQNILLAVKEGITFRRGWINDQFVKNILTLLAEIKCALVVLRPQAFCDVDVTA